MDDYISGMRDRQDKLEGRVTHLEAIVTREAGLRAHMDEELGTISVKLKAQEGSLSALRETQAEHTVRLVRIEKDVSTLKDDVATLKSDMVTVKAGVHAILDLLDTHLAKESLASRLAGRFSGRRDDGSTES